MLEEIVSRLDHIPKEATFSQICTTIVVTIFIMVVITTHRRDRRQDQEQLSKYTLTDAVPRIIGKTDIEANVWCRVKWSITKSGLLLFRGRVRTPAMDEAKAFLDNAVAEKLRSIDPKKEILMGIELDPSWVTALWNEGVITREHFLTSFNTHNGVEIKGLALTGKPFLVHLVERKATTPIVFLTRQLLSTQDSSSKELLHCSCRTQTA